MIEATRPLFPRLDLIPGVCVRCGAEARVRLPTKERVCGACYETAWNEAEQRWKEQHG